MLRTNLRKSDSWGTYLYFAPLKLLRSHIKGKIQLLGWNNAITAQRIKRHPSIIGKLKRFPQMHLSRMQDIGGTRVILPDNAQVRNLQELLAADAGESLSLISTKDYISTPKEDGYRGIHQIFNYRNPDPNSVIKNLRIELQLRTALQHSWATAVEILSTLESQDFKTGKGAEDFKLFFKLASALISYHEHQPLLAEFKNRPITDISAQFCRLEKKLKVFEKLEASAIKQIGNQPQQSFPYFQMLELNSEQEIISFLNFSEKETAIAEELYRKKEDEGKDRPELIVVLISVDPANEVKKAYPNYFLDATVFVANLKSIISRILSPVLPS